MDRADQIPLDADVAARSVDRGRRMVARRAKGFQDAEAWDLRYWQDQGPEERLSALVAIRADVLKVEQSRRNPG